MGTTNRGQGDRTDECRPALARDIDQQLAETVDRMGGLCRILAEEIVVFEYLNERKSRHELDQEDLRF